MKERPIIIDNHVPVLFKVIPEPMLPITLYILITDKIPAATGAGISRSVAAGTMWTLIICWMKPTQKTVPLKIQNDRVLMAFQRLYFFPLNFKLFEGLLKSNRCFIWPDFLNIRIPDMEFNISTMPPKSIKAMLQPYENIK